MAIYGYTKNYKLIKPKYDTDTWHDYEYDNLDTIDAVLSAIYASGNWQGFWKSNTHYNVRDIVIDRDTDTMYKVMVEHTTSAGSFAAEQTAHPDYYELWSPNNLAESWAIKTDDKVSSTDYSAKAYAISSGLINDGSAKEWAIGSGAIGNTNEYSAKKYAADAHNDYISMTTNANVVAVSSNINNVNAVGQSISNVNTVASNVSSVNTVGNSISSVNTAASNMAAIQAAPTAASNAANSANNSHIWAEGTDAQVQALGGVHSSKGWAEQSTNANISLTNSPYTTNRILEIPQDIKLELNNGTLTLKAGSKLYVPNGFEADGTTPKFDTVITSNDATLTVNPDNLLSCFYSNVGLLYNATKFQVFSGGTAPTGQTYMTWYDTTNNIIKRTIDGGSTWISDNISFPLCVLSSTSVIDQIFNGFGYIGSTVFALPGVKVQTPNGKNTDGTYKSVIRTIDSVRTFDAGAWGTRNLNISFSGGVDSILFETLPTDWFTYNKKFSSDTATVSYDGNTGIWWYSPDQSSWSQISVNIVGSCRVESGRITSFEPYTVDSVLNSNLSNLSAAGQDVILNIAAQNDNPTGTIIIWSAPNPPAGYLVCNGAAISRTTYAALFKVIGTTWGAGDGSTTFNVPNLVDRSPWYSGNLPVGQYGNGHLPNITGVFTGDRIALSFSTSGAFYNTTSVTRGNPSGSEANTAAVGFDASRSSQVYSAVDRVIPAFATCLYCIRY